MGKKRGRKERDERERGREGKGRRGPQSKFLATPLFKARTELNLKMK